MEIKKRITRKTILKALFTAYAIVSVCFTTMAVDHLLSKEYPEISRCITLNDSWNITINGTLYQNVSIDDFHFDSVNKGDRITMTTHLPMRKTARKMRFCCTPDSVRSRFMWTTTRSISTAGIGSPEKKPWEAVI